MLINKESKWIGFIFQFTAMTMLVSYPLMVQSATTIRHSISLTASYNNQDSHYTIRYPANWIYDASEKGAVVFSGKQNTPSYYSTVNIQTILTKKTGGDYTNTEQFMADVKAQTLQESPNASFIDKGPIVLTDREGAKVMGQYLTFIYSYKGQLFEQWQIVVLRNDGQVFYTFAYTSPVDQYKTDLDIAQAMFKTWSIYK